MAESRIIPSGLTIYKSTKNYYFVRNGEGYSLGSNNKATRVADKYPKGSNTVLLVEGSDDYKNAISRVNKIKATTKFWKFVYGTQITAPNEQQDATTQQQDATTDQQADTTEHMDTSRVLPPNKRTREEDNDAASLTQNNQLVPYTGTTPAAENNEIVEYRSKKQHVSRETEIRAGEQTFDTEQLSYINNLQRPFDKDTHEYAWYQQVKDIYRFHSFRFENQRDFKKQFLLTDIKNTKDADNFIRNYDKYKLKTAIIYKYGDSLITVNDASVMRIDSDGARTPLARLPNGVTEIAVPERLKDEFLESPEGFLLKLRDYVFQRENRLKIEHTKQLKEQEKQFAQQLHRQQLKLSAEANDLNRFHGKTINELLGAMEIVSADRDRFLQEYTAAENKSEALQRYMGEYLSALSQQLSDYLAYVNKFHIDQSNALIYETAVQAANAHNEIVQRLAEKHEFEKNEMYDKGIKELNKVIRIGKAHIQALEAKNTELQSTNQQLTQAGSTLYGEHQQLKQNKADLLAENERLSAANKQLRQAVQKLRDEAAVSGDLLESVEDVEKETEAKLKELSAKLQEVSAKLQEGLVKPASVDASTQTEVSGDIISESEHAIAMSDQFRGVVDTFSQQLAAARSKSDVVQAINAVKHAPYDTQAIIGASHAVPMTPPPTTKRTRIQSEAIPRRQLFGSGSQVTESQVTGSTSQVTESQVTESQVTMDPMQPATAPITGSDISWSAQGADTTPDAFSAYTSAEPLSGSNFEHVPNAKEAVDPGPLEPRKTRESWFGTELKTKLRVQYDGPRVYRQVVVDLSGIRTAAVSDFSPSRQGTYNPQAWFEGTTLADDESLRNDEPLHDFANTNGVHFVGQMLPNELKAPWSVLDESIHAYLQGRVLLNDVMQAIGRMQRVVLMYQTRKAGRPMKLLGALALAASTCQYALKFQTRSGHKNTAL